MECRLLQLLCLTIKMLAVVTRFGGLIRRARLKGILMRENVSNSGYGVLRSAGQMMLIFAALTLAGCSSTSNSAAYKAGIPSGAGGSYKIGKPYQVAGVWYYPAENERYDSTGIASWYGPNFHGKKTANGEVFDENLLTAAHPTLPMPVLVRVTNLENGKSLVVRVNDRGPFVAGREIDLSKHAAELLGYQRKGTARVRVQYLGRAPLPGQPGTMVSQAQGVGETFVAPRAETDRTESQVAASVVTTSVSAAELPAPRGATTAPPRVVTPTAQTLTNMKPVPDPDPLPAEASPMTGEVEQVPVAYGTRLYVQAGSFTDINNAQKVQRQLSGVGNVQISPTIVDGRQYYRVRVGPLSDVGAADNSLQSIINRGHAGARIVVE
ncbi:MAG: septal ring lytic transglycosylase RlpA family protein [Rhizobiales bacterium]|nr:septal ring lytic transglycosylase RlpA family protein [Hyphomicrobiales bacterium]